MIIAARPTADGPHLDRFGWKLKIADLDLMGLLMSVRRAVSKWMYSVENCDLHGINENRN